MLKPDTARLMVNNHNPEGFTPRGLGFAVGSKSGGAGCRRRPSATRAPGDARVGGSRDGQRVRGPHDAPGAAVTPHPRELVSDLVAKAVS